MPILSKSRQKWIDRVIANLTSSLDAVYPLVSLVEMARSLGIKVYESDLSKISGSLGGFIIYDDPVQKTNPRIYIEKKLTPIRKRFTLAHELGHHVLHEGIKLYLDNYDYSAEGKDAEDESEANYFAASLLIPKELLIEKLDQGKTPKELAEYFQVPLATMKNRITWVQGT